MLTLSTTAFTLHKEGIASARCEDAYAVDPNGRRVAISDGASDSFESRSWAQLLSDAFVQAPPELTPEAFSTWLKGLARAWNASIDWSELAWYAEQKAREVGGLATFLGLCIDEETNGSQNGSNKKWRAIAVGDACMIQVRGNKVLEKFPVSDAESFGDTPALVSTILHHQEQLVEAGLSIKKGSCEIGDLFILATDALAEWLYRVISYEGEERHLPTWDQIVKLISFDFSTLVCLLRATGALHNDDSTLVLVRIAEDARVVPDDIEVEEDRFNWFGAGMPGITEERGPF